MQIRFLGKVQQQEHFSGVLQKISRRFPLKLPLTVYIIQTKEAYQKLLHQFPAAHRDTFALAYAMGRTSFSFLQKTLQFLFLLLLLKKLF